MIHSIILITLALLKIAAYVAPVVIAGLLAARRWA